MFKARILHILNTKFYIEVLDKVEMTAYNNVHRFSEDEIYPLKIDNTTLLDNFRKKSKQEIISDSVLVVIRISM